MNAASQQASTYCSCCGALLTDPISKKFGVGPICRKKLQQFFGSAGTSIEEVRQLALLDQPEVNRWLKLMARATRDNNRKYAKRFIEAARRAVSLPLICEAEAA